MKKLFLLTAALAFLNVSNAQKTEKVQPKKVITAKETAIKQETKQVTEKVVTKKEKVVGKVKKQVVEKGVSNMQDAKVLANPTITDKADMPSRIEEAVLPNSGMPGGVQQIQPAVNPNPTPAPPPAPMADPAKDFEFTNDAYDFGKIPAGKPAKYTLSIKNISAEEQELTLVQPGCGCTTPEYTQGQKIAPGESVKVNLGFNGGGATGSPFSKSVTVTLKGHNPKVVTFKGETFTVPTESAPTNEAADKLKPAGQ